MIDDLLRLIQILFLKFQRFVTINTNVIICRIYIVKILVLLFSKKN